MPGTPGAKPIHVAVIVAHGVGEAEPGEAVAALVANLRNRVALPLAPEPHMEVMRLADVKSAADEGEKGEDDGRPPPAGSTFPVFFQDAHWGAGHRLTFAELYWADLSRIGTGRIASMLGLFRVIFEAQYLIDAMLARRGGVVVAGLQTMLLWLSWLLRGPIAGLTACTAALYAVSLYARPSGVLAPVASDPRLLFAIVLCCICVAALGLLYWSGARGDPTWKTTLGWAVIMSLAVLALCLTAPSPVSDLLRPRGDTSESAYLFSLIYETTINAWRWIWVPCWCLCVAVVLVMGIGRIFSRRNKRRYARAVAATAILSLQFVLWTALVGTALLPLLTRGQEIIGLTELQRVDAAEPAYARGLEQRSQKFSEVRQLLNVSPFSHRDYNWIERFIFLYGMNSLNVVLFIGLGIAVYNWRGLEARRARGADETELGARARKVPRLLFHWLLLGSLLSMTMLQVTFRIIFSKSAQEGSVRELLAASLGDVFNHHLTLTIGFAWISALLFPALMGRSFNNAVHIARDLIDHQFGPKEGRTLKLGGGTELPAEQRWPRRARVKRRLHAVLGALARRGGYDQLVFVAHSQGSVVVYDFLKAAGPANVTLGGLVPGVITVGSPLSHFYERYYHEYDDVSETLGALDGRVGRWINLYRIDDPIGLWLDQAGGGHVENRPLDPGGHVDYWREAKVAGALEELIGPIASVGAAHDGSRTADGRARI